MCPFRVIHFKEKIHSSKGVRCDLLLDGWMALVFKGDKQILLFQPPNNRKITEKNNIELQKLIKLFNNNTYYQFAGKKNHWVFFLFSFTNSPTKKTLMEMN